MLNKSCSTEGIGAYLRFQLPYSFKKLGFALFASMFILMFMNAFTMNIDFIKAASKYGILIGLLIVSISKDANEDERIIKLRMQSYAFAFIAGIFMAILTPLANVLVDSFYKNEAFMPKPNGDWLILWILLFTQVFVFEIEKRRHC